MMKRIFILLAFLLGGAAFSIAQTPNNIRWVHKINGIPSYTSAYTPFGKVQMDKLGNSYMMEYANITTPQVNDSTKCYIVKIDPLGNLVWRKFIATKISLLPGGGLWFDFEFTMDANGDFYLASGFTQEHWIFYTQPSNILSPDYNGRCYYWVAKWNHEGELQWFRHTTPVNSDYSGREQFLNGLLTDQSGAVYVYSDFYGAQDFDPGPGTSILSPADSTAFHLVLWKLDASGNFAWVNNFGGNVGVQPTSLTSYSYNVAINNMAVSLPKRKEGAASQQKIFIVGNVRHSSDFDPGPGVTMVDSGAFMAEYKTNGDLVWAGNPNGGTGYMAIQGVATDSNNNVYLTGGYWGSPNIAGPNASANYYLPNNNTNGHFATTTNAFVAKLDSTGNVNWAKVIKRDSTKGYVITGIPAVDDSNQLYIPGIITCINCTLNFNTAANPVTVTTNSKQDGFVLKLAANTGNFDWLYRTHGIQNSNGCSIFSVARDQYNNVFANGYVADGVSFNMSGPPNIWYPAGGGGSFLIKLGECPPNVDSATAYACHSYALGGQSFDSSGFYAVQLPASNSSCDSIVALTLHLQPIDPSISTDGDTLIANAPGATYQWLHCDGNGGYQLVPGATDRHFIPPTPGNYAVAVSYQDCKDTSGCVLGIENVSIGADVQIAPNPTTNQFRVLFSQTVRHMHLKLVNAVGQTIWQEADFSGQTLTVNMQQYSAGLYYLSIQNEKGVVVKKVVKW